jgi:hypothetical protein
MLLKLTVIKEHEAVKNHTEECKNNFMSTDMSKKNTNASL